MKFLALLGVLAVPFLSGAAFATSTSSSDGALAVKNADGRLIFNGRGAVIGRLDKGQVTIKDPNPYDGTGPIVTGADSTQSIGDRTTRYSGTNIRFRIIGGTFTVSVFATGIDASVIGKGLVTLDGTSTTDGTYALNGGTSNAFPAFRLTFPLAAPANGNG
jgi:subtilisin family serine protease